MVNEPLFKATAKASRELPKYSGDRKILRWPEVYQRTGRSRTQIWRDVQAGRFPAPVQIGRNAIGWWADEVADWQASCPRVYYAPDPSVGDKA